MPYGKRTSSRRILAEPALRRGRAASYSPYADQQGDGKSVLRERNPRFRQAGIGARAHLLPAPRSWRTCQGGSILSKQAVDVQAHRRERGRSQAGFDCGHNRLGRGVRSSVPDGEYSHLGRGGNRRRRNGHCAGAFSVVPLSGVHDARAVRGPAV